MNSFFAGQFNYCPLLRTFHSRSNNNKITHLHERYFRLIHCDKSSVYEALLERDGSVSIHHKTIQAVAIEMFKILNGISPEITNDLFIERTENQYNLHHVNYFNTAHTRTVYHGSESLL